MYYACLCLWIIIFDLSICIQSRFISPWGIKSCTCVKRDAFLSPSVFCIEHCVCPCVVENIYLSLMYKVYGQSFECSLYLIGRPLGLHVVQTCLCITEVVVTVCMVHQVEDFLKDQFFSFIYMKIVIILEMLAVRIISASKYNNMSLVLFHRPLC